MKNARFHRTGLWSSLSAPKALALGALLTLGWATEAFGDSKPPPNLLLIVLDDFGYNDLGANGNKEVSTPNLDEFASQGIRFTRHYADSTCRPSRAALLTGKFASRIAQPAQFIGISPQIVTLPETLRQQGYQTVHVGKWHLGHLVEAAWPPAQGFDEWFGFLDQFRLGPPSKDGQFHRHAYLDPWLQGSGKPRQQYQGHLTDILSSHAAQSIERLGEGLKPWFINLWFLAPHAPIQPAKRFAARYPDTEKGRFLALLAQLDEAVGRVLSALDATGQSENTLVAILSDNGGTNAAMDNNYPFHGKKITFLEGGVRTPMLLRWPQVLPKDEEIAATVSIVDVFPTFARAAGAEVPTDVDGFDLLPLAAGDASSLPARPIYWQLVTRRYFSFATLSSDGRWRLANDQLFDLQEDPTGSHNVADRHPEVVSQMTEQSLRWQQETSRVDLHFDRRGPGGGLLTGSDFLRAPGVGGFTFAIGVEPMNQGTGIQPIVQQPGIWSMSLEPDKLIMRNGTTELEGPPLVSGRCTAVVMSSYQFSSLVAPGNSTAVYHLYLDGRLLRTVRRRPTTPAPDDLRLPTLIGHDIDGNTFDGILSVPLVFNTYLGLEQSSSEPAEWLPPGGTPPPSESLLADIQKTVCPDGNSAGQPEWVPETSPERNIRPRLRWLSYTGCRRARGDRSCRYPLHSSEPRIRGKNSVEVTHKRSGSLNAVSADSLTARER